MDGHAEVEVAPIENAGHDGLNEQHHVIMNGNELDAQQETHEEVPPPESPHIDIPSEGRRYSGTRNSTPTLEPMVSYEIICV
jgi:hypothetical protein